MSEASSHEEVEKAAGAESPDSADAGLPAAPGAAQVSTLGRDQWRAIKQITERIYTYRNEDGHDPSKVFHRKVNKRSLPDYYDVIKEPVALSTMRAKILHKAYTSFEEYVRDAALISHNAQTYNRPEAGAYHDALTLKEIFQGEFQSLVDQGIITWETAQYPDLGDLPPVEDLPPLLNAEDGDEGEEEDEEEEDEEDEEESDDEGVKRRRRRGPRSLSIALKKEGASRSDRGKGDDSRKRRGRPPKVDTPLEARIQNVLKGIRRLKSSKGHVMSLSFEKLPDKTELPDYYVEIKVPLAIEHIKRKAKRKKYHSVDHFLRDVDLMFNNCKSYNMEDSQVYKDAVALQVEAHKLAEEEKARPDHEYALEEGRMPLPDGITYNGELWKIGDWVHLQNPNDVTKPVVAQIYRTWQDGSGDKWINACWYYRPEQTIHQYEKYFFTQEVMKTGQYRDHRVDEIVDRCFVMFVTRYGRGRPRGLDPSKEVYVCESRYNEEKHKMNKIKTWASCLPDEVRDQDYEMDLFDQARRVRKAPSPLLHLLNDDTKEVDAKPRWGVDNAPPIVGAIFKGPRDENQTPPPQPSPSPPLQPPSHITKPRPSMSSTGQPSDLNRVDPRTSTNQPTPKPNYPPTRLTPSHQPTASSTPPIQTQQFPPQSVNHLNPSTDHFSNAPNRYNPAQRTQLPEPNYGRSDEVFRLSENANLAIPPEVRERFQQDENGHVLFFTAPPMETLAPVKPGSAVGHTAKYLAAKLRSEIAAKEKRNASAVAEPTVDLANATSAKKVKLTTAESELSNEIQALQQDALSVLISQLHNSADHVYKDLYGTHWEEGKRYESEKLRAKQQKAKGAWGRKQAKPVRSWNCERESILSTNVYKDDLNPRY